MRRPKPQREIDTSRDWATSCGGRPGLARRERSRRVHSSSTRRTERVRRRRRPIPRRRPERQALAAGPGRPLPPIRRHGCGGEVVADAVRRRLHAPPRRSPGGHVERRYLGGVATPTSRAKASTTRAACCDGNTWPTAVAVDAAGRWIHEGYLGRARRVDPSAGPLASRRHRLRLRPAPPRRVRPDRKPVQQARGRGHLRLDDGRATAPRRGDGAGGRSSRTVRRRAGRGEGSLEHRAEGMCRRGRR